MTTDGPIQSRIARIQCALALVIALLAGSPLASTAATISGFVRAAESGEAIPYASVRITTLKRGAQTNASGYYAIPGLVAGTYDVSLSALGYRSETRQIALTDAQDVTLTVDLQTAPQQMAEIEVKPDRTKLPVETSMLRLDTSQLGRTPAAIEADVFRAVQALPGVSTQSDFSAGLYVRGGSPDQNLILLDEVDVYNPNHLFGFFSTFNVDAVKTVDLQKSGFPAQYGGRLSSLLDVHNRDGNRKEFQGVAHVGVIASSATLEGPWARGSWLVSGRHTYLKTLASALDVDLPYKFYDVQSRFNFDPAPNDRLSLSFYTGRDRLAWDKPGLDLTLDWGNETWSSQWTHVFTPKLFSRTVVGHSRFDSRTDAEFRDFGFHSINRIRDLALKQHFSWAASTAHRIDAGVEAKSLDFGFRTSIGDADPIRFDYRGRYAAAYAQDAWRIDEAWQLQSGLRLDHYSEGNYWRIDPRITLSRDIMASARAHATYGRYHQFLNLVSEEGASFADRWFPVDRTLSPGQADHYIVGIELGPYAGYDISLEGYSKEYQNVVEYSAEFQRSLVTSGATMSDLFNRGKGRSRGMDLYIRNHGRKWDGWFGYSYGQSNRRIVGYNFGREYQPDYDRRHQVVVSQNRPLGKRWNANFTFHYGSGQPLTLPVGRYTVLDVNGREYDVILDGARNSERLPDYHRLDLGLVGSYRFRGWKIQPEIQVVNLYNHQNVYLRSYDTGRNPATVDDVTMLPFLPTLGVKVEF